MSLLNHGFVKINSWRVECLRKTFLFLELLGLIACETQSRFNKTLRLRTVMPGSSHRPPNRSWCWKTLDTQNCPCWTLAPSRNRLVAVDVSLVCSIPPDWKIECLPGGEDSRVSLPLRMPPSTLSLNNWGVPKTCRKENIEAYLGLYIIDVFAYLLQTQQDGIYIQSESSSESREKRHRLNSSPIEDL